MLPHQTLTLVLLILSVFSRYSFLVAGQDETPPTDPPIIVEPPPPPPPPEDGESKVYPVDETLFTGFKEELCEHVPALGGSEDKSSWSDTLDLDEIYELAFLNLGYGLTADAVAHLPIDLGWRKVLVDQMAYITRTTCNTPSISSMFLNGVKNLFQYYLFKYDKFVEKATNNTIKGWWKAENYQEQWTEIINSLSKCAAEAEPIKFNDDCGVLDSYIDSKGLSQPTKEIEEQFDEEFEDSIYGLDLVIDSIWWMFSLTYARCYAFFYPNEDIILIFLQRFREDVIRFFEQRWRGAGELTPQFAIVFGPISAELEYSNLRKCSTTSFDYEGLTGRSLVRPVIVQVPDEKGVIRDMRNFKLESDLGENER